jgi:hypothetical protein
MATPTTINVEAIIAGFRRSLLQTERESVIQNDSAIEDTIENVRHQVEQNEQGAVDDHDSSQEEPVAIQHRVDEKSACARNAEDALHHDGTGQQVGGKRAYKSNDREYRDTQGMFVDYLGFRQTFRASGSNEILGKNFQHARAGEPGNVSGVWCGQSNRRKDQTLQVSPTTDRK